MAVSRTQICNMALSHVGNSYLIDNLEEGSQQADVCKLFYLDLLDSLLRKLGPPFARRREKLALISESEHHTPGHSWRFVYRQPVDCLKINNIISDTHLRVGQVPYQRGRNESVKVIYSDMENAELDYISRPDESFFDSDFTFLLSLALGVSIATPLSSDSRILSNVKALYDEALRDAELSMAQESTHPEQPESEFIRVRDVEHYDNLKRHLE